MIWNIFEYGATIIEACIYSNFMLKFLGTKKYNYKWCFLIILLFDVGITMLFNHFTNFEGALCLIRIGINFILAMFLLNGTMFEKIFAALSLDILALLISFISLKSLGWLSDRTIEEMIEYRGLIRLLNLFITKALLFTATQMLLKLKSNKKYSLSINEWITISVIFLITMSIGLGVFRVNLDMGISSESPLSVGIGLGLISINVLIYILMKRISEKNTENTELLIDKMQNEIYKVQYEGFDKQYSEMRKIRHDMENHLQYVSMLIAQKDYEEANDYISDILKHRLNFGISRIRTGNKVIDTVANMKLIQCKNENINTIVTTGHIETSINDIDMCSLLGNIFDNAIEACRKVDGEKELHFEVIQKKGYINIIMKNTIQSPVLENNPDLSTTKKQKDIHGYGVKNVKDIVKRHNGMVEFFEKDKMFIADIWIPCKDFE